MQKQKRYDFLPLTALSSLAALKSWLKENISFYRFEKEISESDLLIYFDYIENKVRESQEIDRVFWLKLIRGLREKLRVVKNEE